MSYGAQPVRLADLEPRLVGTLADGVLTFRCPRSECDHNVRVSISNAPFHLRTARHPSEMGAKRGKVKVWKASGSFPDALTLSPCIALVCSQWSITDGEIK